MVEFDTCGLMVAIGNFKLGGNFGFLGEARSRCETITVADNCALPLKPVVPSQTLWKRLTSADANILWYERDLCEVQSIALPQLGDVPKERAMATRYAQ